MSGASPGVEALRARRHSTASFDSVVVGAGGGSERGRSGSRDRGGALSSLSGGGSGNLGQSLAESSPQSSLPPRRGSAGGGVIAMAAAMNSPLNKQRVVIRGTTKADANGKAGLATRFDEGAGRYADGMSRMGLFWS